MVKPPLAPMLARSVEQIPKGNFYYEPKWDGFRAIIFANDREIYIGSRGEKELTRYFPELVAEFGKQLAGEYVLDGEIVVPRLSAQGSGALDFSALQQRIHPAESRVRRLALETPAHFIAFDLLQVGKEELLKEPFAKRRERLAELLKDCTSPLHLTASTQEFDRAHDWFRKFEGAGLDGVVAKAADLTYQPGERAMYKIKHFRSADCVVAGYRPHKSQPNAVGALLLGLYDDGLLHYVGSTSSFSTAVRSELAEILEPLRTEDHPWLGPSEGQRVPGNVSRWTGKKDLSFVPLQPLLVCEVRYDQLEGDRFRHTTTFLRWRNDREPSSCTYEQLELPEPYDLGSVMT